MIKTLRRNRAAHRPMAVLTCAALAVSSLMFSAFAEEPKTVLIDGNPADPDTVLVKFASEDGDTAVQASSKNPRVARIAAKIRRIKMFRNLRRQAAIELRQDATGDKATRLKERIQELRDSGLFEYVEPDYIVKLVASPTDTAFTNGTLWGLRNTGQKSGKSGADIEAVTAWDQTTGSANVVVGIIDSGIRYTHQDLEANMWVNTDEIPDNGIDDDGNGYIDDIHGINSIDGSGDPMDDNSHGSHCAGTIGASANGDGPHVGVNWKVSLMGLKFLTAKGSGKNSNAIECIDYAIDQGVDIVNNSWGGGGYSQALYDAISRAKDAGILFVVAASNEGTNNDTKARYPSNFAVSNIISVAAIDRNDKLASFSNYGASTVHLGAPGVDIYSTTAESDTAYDTYDGTSMAAPHVAGVAALVKAKYPSLTLAQLKARLVDNTRPVDALNGRTITGGAVSALRALQNVTTPVPQGTTFAAGSLPKNIPDRGTVTSSINVNGQPTSIALSSVVVKLNVSHTYVGDLIIKLQPPKGRAITLWQRAGKAQSSVILNQALTQRKAINPNGTWTITVQDKAAADSGTLNSWSLEFPSRN
jgi:subtilisin family serine protease